MEINKTQTGNAVVLALTGKLDTTTSLKLQEALGEAISSAEKVELDFSAIDYVSSAGLRILLQGEKNAQASGKSMVLLNVPPEVMEVFELTGFSSILTIR
jgi:anti-anti-sigma factor